MHLGDQADRFGTVLRIGGQEAPVGKGLGQVPGDGDAVGQQAAFGRSDDGHRARAAEGRDLGREFVRIDAGRVDRDVDPEDREGEPAAQRPGRMAALADEKLIGHGPIGRQAGAAVNRQALIGSIRRRD
jgi:hypothetical protein